jgi:hypothetical protein
VQLAGLEVGGNGPLARLRRAEHDRDAAQGVAGDRLKLHDVGAEVGEESRRVRTGVERAEVEDPHAVQQARLGVAVRR